MKHALTDMSRSARGRTAAAVVILLTFLLLALAVILTRSPWWDEGVLVDPAYNLCEHGRLASTILSSKGHPLIRELVDYDKYTYWTVPLYLVTLAGWIKVFGASLLAVRFLSVFWGLAIIGAGYVIVRRLTNSRGIGLLAALLLATDYTVVLSCVTARMDAMATALGYAGIALYLTTRERNLRLACFASGICTAASVLTHPAGIIHSGGLALTALYLDWRRIRWRELLAVVIPYVAFAGSWALYIAQAPSVFVLQMKAHASYRVGGLSSPIQAVMGDLTDRYFRWYLPAESFAAKLKALILLAYLATMVAAVAVPSIRRAPGVRLLLMLTGLY